ncbi:MAG TPA: 1-acyl-sn-glycerol-3-phosphate acyltransferase [Candidatus Ornithospirochaeta stercorigallinarum]|nr:1-acyl-sn-glycerol-3-phosphate acyltransferase [Candidatus Ornithospirochaeta stercorigallinarum]
MKDRDVKYGDITPFFGEDFEKAFARFLSQTDKIASFANSFVPEGEDGKKILINYINSVKDKVHSYTDFQSLLTMGIFSPAVLRNTSDGFTTSGAENIDPDKAYLYVSTHRDIVLDCTLMDYALFLNKKPMCQMAFGDNLIANPFIGDLLRLNGGIIVKRNLPMREKYLETIRLSEYFVDTIIEDNYSIWVAQKSGRSKDGIDDTHPAIIKMLYLSKKGTGISFNELINRLRIVPTAISYQYNPNDINMSREEVKTIREGHYDKRKYEDTISMMKGIRGYKGKIHVSFGKPLEGDFERPEDVAREIDRQIHLNYKLWDTNYFAYDYLESSSRFKDEYKDFDTERFLSLFAHLHDDVRTFVLNSYANPVREALKEKE